jgi:2-methylcitrate dehydratase
MSSHDIRSAKRADPDQPMVDIANYVADYTIDSREAFDTARYMLLDSLACAMLAMKFPECVKHLGPLVPGAVLPGGARVPGTAWELDPVQAAYNIGVQVRWLDFNDTWLAAEWGHPSDNLGAILCRRRLPLAQGRTRRRHTADRSRRARLRDQGARNPGLLRAQEFVQSRRARSRDPGAPALDRGRDADARAAAGRHRQRGLAQLDRRRRAAHVPARAEYRPRKSWAAGRACRARDARVERGQGCVGYPSALTAKTWGFYDMLFKGKRSSSSGRSAAT